METVLYGAAVQLQALVSLYSQRVHFIVVLFLTQLTRGVSDEIETQILGILRHEKNAPRNSQSHTLVQIQSKTINALQTLVFIGIIFYSLATSKRLALFKTPFELHYDIIVLAFYARLVFSVNIAKLIDLFLLQSRALIGYFGKRALVLTNQALIGL